MAAKSKFLAPLLAVGVLLLVLVLAHGAAVPPARQPGAPAVQIFFYDAPFQAQRKLEIRWASDYISPTGGNTIFREVQADTFYRETGARELTMEAPECVFNLSELSGTSPGTLTVRTGDSNAVIQGTGYRWQYKGSNFTVTISNSVTTKLRRDFLAATNKQASLAPAGGSNEFVFIHADRVTLDRISNLITYSGHVQAEDDLSLMTCDVLEVHGAANSGTAAKIARIVADQHVIIVYKPTGGRATGERAVYDAADGGQVLTLTGNPRWDDLDHTGDGTAQVFIFDHALNAIRANGDAHFRVRTNSISQSGFILSSQPTTAIADTNADSRLIDITAGALTVQLPATNHGPLQSFIAETNVVIFDPANSNRASGDRAFYRQGDSQFELTGNAAWESGHRIARGDWLSLNRERQTFAARTNAFLQFPLESVRQSPALAGRFSTNSTTNLLLTVSSDSYDYADDTLTFHDRVHGEVLDDTNILGTLDSRVLEIGFTNTNVVRYARADDHARLHQPPTLDAQGRTQEANVSGNHLEIYMRTSDLIEWVAASGAVSAVRTLTTNGLPPSRTSLTTDAFTATFQPTTNQVDVVTSDGHVVMSRDGEIGRGAKVVYTFTNDTAVLTGDPRLERTNGWLSADDAIIYDRAHGVARAINRTKTVFYIPPGALDKVNMPTGMKKITK